MFTTLCRICEKVITTPLGRIESAIYDSALARKYPKAPEEGKVWAFCEKCYGSTTKLEQS
jgi:hypothetical protein